MNAAIIEMCVIHGVIIYRWCFAVSNGGYVWAFAWCRAYSFCFIRCGQKFIGITITIRKRTETLHRHTEMYTVSNAMVILNRSWAGGEKNRLTAGTVAAQQPQASASFTFSPGPSSRLPRRGCRRCTRRGGLPCGRTSRLPPSPKSQWARRRRIRPRSC